MGDGGDPYSVFFGCLESAEDVEQSHVVALGAGELGAGIHGLLSLIRRVHKDRVG